MAELKTIAIPFTEWNAPQPEFQHVPKRGNSSFAKARGKGWFHDPAKAKRVETPQIRPQWCFEGGPGLPRFGTPRRLP